MVVLGLGVKLLEFFFSRETHSGVLYERIFHHQDVPCNKQQNGAAMCDKHMFGVE